MTHSERFEELAALQALGLPLGEEASEFAAHRESGCPTCEQLLVDFREAATALAAQAPEVQPRTQVKERILASIAPASKADRRKDGGGFVRAILALAAALLLVAVIADDARLRRQREDLESRAGQLAQNLDSAQRDLARRDLRVRVLESDDVKILSLQGQGPQPSARARVFWSERAKRGVVVAGNLERLPPDKQYELWVFAQGKPVPAGVFDIDPDGRALFESPDLSRILSAQNFAVTVEPRGGVPQPTGPIVLAGTPS